MIDKKELEVPWLSPERRVEVIKTLYCWGLIRWDSSARLPTKHGHTDVYISLRDARGNPSALSFIADLYAEPLRRLSPHRFAEIPHGVSCFAPLIATRTRIPYITIREEPKAGRVSDERIIGPAFQGEAVVLVDDVVSDGFSKIDPYRLCEERGFKTRVLVVLVDREEGWRETFVRENVRLHVWSAMSLNEVRACLKENYN